MKLEVYTYYKYLGVMVSSRLSWGMATRTLASQANKMFIIIKVIQFKCRNIQFDVFCDIFDTWLSLYYVM